MNSIYLSYAEALFSLNKENNKSDKETIEVLDTINSAIDADIKKFLYSKAIKASDKKEVIKNSLKGIDENILGFLYVLIDNNRINELDNIIQAYKRLVMEKSGEIEVTVKSAKELKDINIKLLKKTIKNKFFNNNLDKEIVINFIIDKSLVEGILIEYQNKVYDASIINKEISLKEYLEK